MKWDSVKEWIIKAVGGLFVFLELDINVVIILAYLMVLDTFWGVIKAVTVTSIDFNFKMFYLKGLGKLSFLFIPLTLALMAKGIGLDFRIFVEGVVKIMILTEGISIITNFISIKDNKNYKNGDFATELIHFIRNYLIMFLEKIKAGFGKVKENVLEEENKNKPDNED